MVNDGIAYSFGVIMEPMRADLGGVVPHSLPTINLGGRTAIATDD